MDLLTERRLRYVLALRRIGEATLLRDSDKVSELMNFHRRSDTPLGPPVCLSLADRIAEHTRLACLLGALAEQTARTERRGCKVLDEILGLTFQRLRTQMKSRTPRPGSRGLSTPVILSQTELTAGRTVSHGKAEVGFASS